jgi:hypothetical protein
MNKDHKQHKFVNQLALILLCLVVSVSTTIPDPVSKERVVHMKDTYGKLVKYVKSGDHDKVKNQGGFYEIENDNGLGHCGTGVAPEAWKFLGYTVASIIDTTTKTPEWSNYCFQSNYASFEWVGDYEAKVTITSSRPKFPGCSDTYSLTDIYNFDLKVVDIAGTHTINYKFHEKHNVDYVKKFGLHIIRLCDSHVHLLPDIYLTLALYSMDSYVEGEKGETTPKAVRDAIFAYQYEWLNHWAGYPLKKRSPKVPITVDFLNKNIKTGDVLCRYQGTGIGSLEVWATGGMCSHMGIFMWGQGSDQDKLYFIQSDAKGIRICSIEEFWA